MSDVLDFATVVATTDPVTYQAGDYPASLYIVTPGDGAEFGSHVFGSYRTGSGLGIPNLHFVLEGYYRSGAYTFNYPYSVNLFLYRENNYEVSTLLRNSTKDGVLRCDSRSET